MFSLFFFSTFFSSDLHIAWTFPLPLYQWWKNSPESIASKRIKGSWELAHHTYMLWFYERSFIEGFFLFGVARFFCLGGKGTGNLIFVTPLDSPRQWVFFRSHWKDLKITKESTRMMFNERMLHSITVIQRKDFREKQQQLQFVLESSVWALLLFLHSYFIRPF